MTKIRINYHLSPRRRHAFTIPEARTHSPAPTSSTANPLPSRWKRRRESLRWRNAAATVANFSGRGCERVRARRSGAGSGPLQREMPEEEELHRFRMKYSTSSTPGLAGGVVQE
ncbi:hypothetical protein GWI33_022987 [Rhynchophorus ferrugineus]|uniref:Uncharacterized protein n=1 Tax=Rhynchophorus ferrugineus TaxID=354439 RepID=A0A834ITT6_RHYFE|nr:hypothetical protein GWI33_022987 [Rhynchophorus ferrugineus]